MGATAVRLVVAAFHRHLEDLVGVWVVRFVYHHARGGGGQVAFAQGACGVGRLGRVLEVAQVVVLAALVAQQPEARLYESSQGSAPEASGQQGLRHYQRTFFQTLPVDVATMMR